jgi:hypothetical protein
VVDLYGMMVDVNWDTQISVHTFIYINLSRSSQSPDPDSLLLETLFDETGDTLLGYSDLLRRNLRRLSIKY